MNPRVSVLVPVYNASRYVSACLHSILEQTWTDFELLVMNDGSTDDSQDVIVRAAGNDPRVKIFASANQGLARTLNEMLGMAKGEFIARLDADDESLAERLEKQVRFMDSNPDCVVVGGGVINVDEDGDPLSVELYPARHEDIERRMLAGRGGIIHPSVMIRREPMQRCGGYSTEYPVVEDQDLWLRLALLGRLANLSEPLIRYRVHAGNMSFTDARNAGERLAEVLRRAHADRNMPLPAMDCWVGVPLVDEWERRRQWCWSAVHSNYRATARKHACRLVKERKFDRRAWILLTYAFFPQQAAWIQRVIRQWK